MFRLRLSSGKVLGIGISQDGVELGLFKGDGKHAAKIFTALTRPELDLVARALEVVRRTLAGGTTARVSRTLEMVPSGGTGSLSMFVPTDPNLNGQQAVLWVSNGTGKDGAVYLDQADLERIADWAHSTAQNMRTRAVAWEVEVIVGVQD
jgi:hypothetical protein